MDHVEGCQRGVERYVLSPGLCVVQVLHTVNLPAERLRVLTLMRGVYDPSPAYQGSRSGSEVWATGFATTLALMRTFWCIFLQQISAVRRRTLESCAGTLQARPEGSLRCQRARRHL